MFNHYTDEKVQHLECEAYQKYLQQLKEKETLKKQVATLKERLRILIGKYINK